MSVLPSTTDMQRQTAGAQAVLFFIRWMYRRLTAPSGQVSLYRSAILPVAGGQSLRFKSLGLSARITTPPKPATEIRLLAASASCSLAQACDWRRHRQPPVKQHPLHG